MLLSSMVFRINSHSIPFVKYNIDGNDSGVFFVPIVYVAQEEFVVRPVDGTLDVSR